MELFVFVGVVLAVIAVLHRRVRGGTTDPPEAQRTGLPDFLLEKDCRNVRLEDGGRTWSRGSGVD